MNNQQYTKVLFGAADPEQVYAEKWLYPSQILYAAVQDPKTKIVRRVYASEAYKATHLLTPGGSVLLAGNGPAPDGQEEGWFDTSRWYVACFECKVEGVNPVVVFDHHNPGDPGYGQPPEKFLPASSIGQMIAFMENGVWEYEHEYMQGWHLNAQGRRYVPPYYEQVAYVAAADHCLAAAYQDRCPGINRDKLLEIRAEEKARFQKRPVKDVLRDIQETARVLEFERTNQGEWTGSNECWQCGTNDHPDCYYGPARKELPIYNTVQLGERHLPELPETASYCGIAYICTVTEPTGRKKEVYGGCTSEGPLKWWMQEMKHKGREVYGDPARGFAGAYLPPQ